jgi:AcrR family transcriptional regulator
MAKKDTSSRLDRAAVLDASRTIVNRNGFTDLTLASLAAELDRHVSSLYNHVEGLEGLRRDITVLALTELGEELRRAVLGRGGVAGVRALAAAYRRFARENPGLFEAATTWRSGNEKYVSELRRAADPAGEALHAVMRSFGLEGEDVIHATRTFSGSIVGFIRAENSTYGEPGPPLDESFEVLVDLFVFGLTNEWPAKRGSA